MPKKKRFNKSFKLVNDQSVHDAMAVMVAVMSTEDDQDKAYEVVIREYSETRSLRQNALSHAWYREVERKGKEYTASQIKCLCKYHFGLNILRGDDPDYNEKCVKFIDPLPYELKLEAMEFFPVTSFFSTKQFNDYLKAVRQNYVGRVDLRFSDECPLIEYSQ